MTRLRAPSNAGRRMIVGNWKMNGDAALLARSLAAVQSFRKHGPLIGFALPHTLIARLDGVAVGAQDVHEAAAGAYTGEVSAAMVRDAGATFTIVGHSERRSHRGEDDNVIASKIARAGEVGLDVLLCCGEPADVRAAGRTVAHILSQLTPSLATADPATLVLAYEPCWAIGTGRTPAPEEIATVAAAIRTNLQVIYGDASDTIPLLYGGSVDASLSRAIASTLTLDGVLIGSASLDPATFRTVAAAFDGK